jgi:drug/metabolite transporter (DMT)-like permease
MENKGIILVLLTAFLSGFSVFLNSFAVKGFNPFILTTMKNLLVTVFLFSIILLLKEYKALLKLKRKHWLQLVLIGLVGGSIPFLLYFYALKLTTAINAGFIHKTMFLFTAALAIVFLKEKLSKRFAIAAGLLLLGNYLVFSSLSSFGFPDLLILVATLLWAVENTYSKHVLKELSGNLVGFGRMFFGSLFMLVFLAATSQLQEAFVLSGAQFNWLVLTSVLLFFYVLFWYNGLKQVSVSKATALLMLGQPVTALLSFVFLGRVVSFNEALGLALIVFGAVLLVGFSTALNRIKKSSSANNLLRFFE